MVRIGVPLSKGQTEQLTELLIKFKEIFAWHLSNMSGIAADVITHKLHIDPFINSVAQR